MDPNLYMSYIVQFVQFIDLDDNFFIMKTIDLK